MKQHVHKIVLFSCVAICLAFVLGSCLTSADLKRVEDRAVVDQQARVEARAKYESGDITIEQLRVEMQKINDETRAELNAVKEDVKDRTKTFGGLLTDPIGTLVTLGAGILANNAVRNASRKKEVEKLEKSIDETDKYVEEVHDDVRQVAKKV